MFVPDVDDLGVGAGSRQSSNGLANRLSPTVVVFPAMHRDQDSPARRPLTAPLTRTLSLRLRGERCTGESQVASGVMTPVVVPWVIG